MLSYKSPCFAKSSPHSPPSTMWATLILDPDDATQYSSPASVLDTCPLKASRRADF